MPFSFFRSLAAAFLLLVLAVFTSALTAESSFAEEMSQEEKARIEAIIRSYLLENPELVEEALIALDKKRKEAEAKQHADTIGAIEDVLFNSKRQVVLGNPEASITLVEFFDYNCGYCRRALDDTLRIMQDKDVRIVLKEMPILGPGSVEAARVAIAIHLTAPDRYLDFHQALLKNSGRADEATALAVAEELALDMDAIRTAMKDPEVAATIEEVYGLANRLGITGTPTYVIGDEVVFGAVGASELQAKIEALKSCGGVAC